MAFSRRFFKRSACADGANRPMVSATRKLTGPSGLGIFVRKAHIECMSIPNIITFGRFLAVPAIIYALAHQHMLLAFALFVSAGLSDAVDGFIARQFNQRSELGAWLDPLADKLLLVTLFVMLGRIEQLPDWLVMLVISRDVLIVGAVVLSSVMSQPMQADPIFVSKANTAAQIVLVSVSLFTLAFGVVVDSLISALIVIVALLTIVSAASYFRIWMRHMGSSGLKP